MRVYHRTLRAEARDIVERGFPLGNVVQLQNFPFDSSVIANRANSLHSLLSDRRKALILLLLNMDDDDLSKYAPPGLNGVYKQWLAPSEILNDRIMSVVIIEDSSLVIRDMEIKSLEAEASAKTFDAIASAIREHARSGGSPDILFPDEVMGDLIRKRNEFESMLISRHPRQRVR